MGALNFLSLIGKKYTNSGLDDLLIESGVYAAGTTSALIKGKCYNRGIRGHKLAMEAFFRLLWKSFQQWISDQHPESKHIIREQLHGKISECRVAVQNKSVGQENVEELSHARGGGPTRKIHARFPIPVQNVRILGTVRYNGELPVTIYQG